MCRVEAKEVITVWLYCPVVWLPNLMSTLGLKSVTLSKLPVQYCHCKIGLCLLSPSHKSEWQPSMQSASYATTTLKMEAAHFFTVLASTNKTAPISIIYSNVTLFRFPIKKQTVQPLCLQSCKKKFSTYFVKNMYVTNLSNSHFQHLHEAAC